jgi:hypothetical protein
MKFSITSFLVLPFTITLLSATHCQAAKAGISDVLLCNPPEGPVCRSNAALSRESAVLYFTARVTDIQPGDRLSVTWEYFKENEIMPVDEVRIDLPKGDSVVSSGVTMPEKGWPQGRYQIRIKTEKSGIYYTVPFTL